MKKILSHNYEDIICLDNLLLAWQEFIAGKKNKKDVQDFNNNLFDNILSLHQDLASKKYQHGGYQGFYVNDPKRRHIHKASVRDRLLHHVVYRILYPFFDKKFIADSYSCRLDKGTHKAVNRFRKISCLISRNNTRTCWVLKCDIKKFFASIDRRILIEILEKYITNKDIIWLLKNIIKSFGNGIGLPLGNLTSQLFANIYMDRFDQYVKHQLKVKYYIRYADDFVFLSQEKDYLELLVPVINDFLENGLKLFLHPNKVFIQTINSGVDFLGWVNFCDHRVLRKSTKRRMLRRIENNSKNETLQSYLGLLKHGNTKKIKISILKSLRQKNRDGIRTE